MLPELALSVEMAERRQPPRGNHSPAARLYSDAKDAFRSSNSGQTLAEAKLESATKAEAQNLGAKEDPDHLQKKFCSLLASSAQNNDLPVEFFVSLIWQESRFQPRAVSPAGAVGVAQFMPAVAQNLGVDDPFDPQEALPASARLLRTLRAQFGNLGLAAAAYNAGPKRVLDWLAKRSRLPKETRDYVQIITGLPAENWSSAKPRSVDYRVPAKAPCFASSPSETERAVKTSAPAARLAVPHLKKAMSVQRAAKSSPKTNKWARGTPTKIKLTGDGKVIVLRQPKRIGSTKVAELKTRSK
jgi:soluble lytic murein transglycosylase-like protein